MAAGQGFKTFTTGEVLTAGDVNGYLMQGVLVFASTAARDAAITSPAEGQFAFTKDTNSLFYYDGAAWVASGATGDIEGVTAGIGISGGGTSGTVTVTNSMATAIDAKGDLVAGTGADAFAKLTVGANNTVLTADSAEATGLKWAASAAGGMTLLSTTTLSGATTTISSIDQGYVNLFAIIKNVTNATAAGQMRVAPNNDSNYNSFVTNSGGTTWGSTNGDYLFLSNTVDNVHVSNGNNAFSFTLTNYASSSSYKPFDNTFVYVTSGGGEKFGTAVGGIRDNTAITSLVFSNSGGNLSAGTVLLYGVK